MVQKNKGLFNNRSNGGYELVRQWFNHRGLEVRYAISFLSDDVISHRFMLAR